MPNLLWSDQHVLGLAVVFTSSTIALQLTWIRGMSVLSGRAICLLAVTTFIAAGIACFLAVSMM
jgi:hypothetical protein